jgi:hypothetical protein
MAPALASGAMRKKGTELVERFNDFCALDDCQTKEPANVQESKSSFGIM